jgi:hypothetical protein
MALESFDSLPLWIVIIYSIAARNQHLHFFINFWIRIHQLSSHQKVLRGFSASRDICTSPVPQVISSNIVQRPEQSLTLIHGAEV